MVSLKMKLPNNKVQDVSVLNKYDISSDNKLIEEIKRNDLLKVLYLRTSRDGKMTSVALTEDEVNNTQISLLKLLAPW